MPIRCPQAGKTPRTTLIGDTRKGRHYVPLAFQVMQRFLRVGFVLKEDIITVQHRPRRGSCEF